MKLYAGGYLTFFTPNQVPELDWLVSEPTNLKDLLAEIGIPAGEVQLVILNGQIAEIEHIVVSNQDEIKLFPGVGGG